MGIKRYRKPKERDCVFWSEEHDCGHDGGNCQLFCRPRYCAAFETRDDKLQRCEVCAIGPSCHYRWKNGGNGWCRGYHSTDYFHPSKLPEFIQALLHEDTPEATAVLGDWYEEQGWDKELINEDRRVI